MSKSYESVILGLYTAIFKDISVSLPTVRQLERDENRLLSAVQTRGLRFILIDMPAFSKHFDRCLADGRLTASGIPHFGTLRSSPVPVFLQGLVMRVFEKNGMLTSNPCINSIFMIRQLLNAAKKIEMDCPEKVRESTLNRYIEQERSIRPPSLNWHGGGFDHRPNLVLHSSSHGSGELSLCGHSLLENEPAAEFLDVVHAIADRVCSSFGSFEPNDYRFKHGPGAVADAIGGKFKYEFPTWSQQLERVFPYADFGFANFGHWADSTALSEVASDDVIPSKVLTVRKSQKAPRIIAKEPTANMWCQQAVRDFLERAVADSPIISAISFRDQTNNGRMALEASASETHWTVDLSDASDRLSLWLVERLFRANLTLLNAFQSSRSGYSSVPLKDKDVLISNKKFAPQGSATTFPVQTITFAILAVSSVIYTRGWKVTRANIVRASKEVQVYGDDSLIPADSGRAYVSLLTYCGLTVNYAKTYGTGKFRESCGVEAYDGVDVTPAYIKVPYTESDPTSVSSVVECSNNFFMKFMWHSAAYLESTLPRWVRNHLAVVGPEVGPFGLNSFSGTNIPSVNKTRWNASLQREEYLALSVNTKVTRSQPGGLGHLLQYFTEAPRQDTQWESGVGSRPSSSLRKKWEPLSNLLYNYKEAA